MFVVVVIAQSELLNETEKFRPEKRNACPSIGGALESIAMDLTVLR